MKKGVTIIITFIILICLNLASCSEGKTLKADTPINTGALIKMSIDNNDYQRFNSLFSESRKETISKEDFNKFNSISTAGSSHELYDIITFENGEILLVRLTPEKIDGEYKVEDVIKVPNEIKEFFSTEN